MSKPETVFKVGAVRASVFQNVGVQKGKEVLFPKVVLEVRYKDKAGQWKGTSSMTINDLPKAILALQKAYEYLMVKKADDAPGGDSADAEYPEEMMNVPVVKA